MKVRTVLGEEREVERIYPDGSLDCPFCRQPVLVGTFDPIAEYLICPNGFCDAHPGYPPEQLRQARAERAAKAAAEARRKRDVEWARKRTSAFRELREAWEKEQFAEARRRGTCIKCLWTGRGGDPRFVRHRGPCPKSRK